MEGKVVEVELFFDGDLKVSSIKINSEMNSINEGGGVETNERKVNIELFFGGDLNVGNNSKTEEKIGKFTTTNFFLHLWTVHPSNLWPECGKFRLRMSLVQDPSTA